MHYLYMVYAFTFAVFSLNLPPYEHKKTSLVVPFLTARYTILCTRRLQPPRDDCAVRVQWFTNVKYGQLKGR